MGNKFLFFALSIAITYGPNAQNIQQDSAYEYFKYGNQLYISTPFRNYCSVIKYNGLLGIHIDSRRFEKQFIKIKAKSPDTIRIVKESIISTDSLDQLSICEPDFPYIHVEDSLTANLYKVRMKLDSQSVDVYMHSSFPKDIFIKRLNDGHVIKEIKAIEFDGTTCYFIQYYFDAVKSNNRGEVDVSITIEYFTYLLIP